MDFEVRRGGLRTLGPNGSGKSTTIKMILGLLYPTQGAITVFGESPRDVKTKARIGYLPEELPVPVPESGETLDFFGNLFPPDSAARWNRAEQLIEMVGSTRRRRGPSGNFRRACSAASDWHRR